MPLPGAEDGNQDHRASGAKDGESSPAVATSQEAEDGEPMFGAEDEESRPTGATSQEAEARLRTGSHCLGLKMRNQDRPAGATSPQEAEARVRTGSHCLVPKMKN